MIPALNHSGVLPPFMGASPAVPGTMAPYKASMTELAANFCSTPERRALFRGLLEYRQALRDVGFASGLQWIDGSFCEDVETRLSRPPGDIDVVTLTYPPAGLHDPAQLQAMLVSKPELFDPAQTKARYKCEAFFIDLTQPGYWLARSVAYWFGLFSHQRTTYLWKGMVEIPLVSDDAAAAAAVGPPP